MAFVYAWIAPLWAAQLLPQLLIEQFDTLRIQCRHIEHMHEGVYNFCLAQILLKSSFQNLGLLVLTITCQVFSLNLTVRGVSNKHCLLTIFIRIWQRCFQLYLYYLIFIYSCVLKPFILKQAFDYPFPCVFFTYDVAWERSGRVLDSRPKGRGSSLTGVTVLCP